MMRSIRTPWLLALGSYSVLTVALTWPLVARLNAVLPNDGIDPTWSAWILWWNAHTVPLTTRWWNAPFFWPAQGVFGLSEHFLGLTPITTPLQWLGAGPATTYNVLYLASFPLSALAAHALGYTLTGRHDAGFVSGLVYGFNPYRVSQSPHIQVLASWWMPIALVALHQYVQRREARWLGLFGAAWLLTALSNGYFMLFFPVLIGLWMLWFVAARRRFAVLGTMLAVAAAASLPLLPVVWGYRRIQAALGVHHTISEIRFYSPDLTGFVAASPQLEFWHLTRFAKVEGELFPGAVAVALVAIPVAAWVWRALRMGRWSRWSKSSAVLLVLAATSFAAAASRVVAGPWAISVAGRQLLSVTAIMKPLSIGLLFLVLAVVIDSRVVAAVRRGTTFLFYVLATAILLALALGPEPRLFGHQLVYKVAPYGWLISIPGFDSARVPTRFMMVALVALSAAAGLALARLTARRSPRVRIVAAVLVCAGIVADGWVLQLPLQPLSPRLGALESLPADTVVLELPMHDVAHEAAAMYRSMYHHRPIVNGYSSFTPKHFEILREAIESADPGAIDAMAAYAPLTVALDTRQDDGTWSRFLDGDAGTTSLGREGVFRFFAVPRRPRPPVLLGSTLPVVSVAPSTNARDARLMLDGSLTSRWSTLVPQAGGETVTIDLGAVRSVEALSMALSEKFLDYPRELSVETSTDAAAWSFAWSGRGVGPAIEAATRDPIQVPVTVTFRASAARWIRLREGASHGADAWSIAELQVFGR